MQNQVQRILSIQEVATLLGVHISTIHRWCAAGIFIPKVRFGESRVGFWSEDVHDWIAARREASGIVAPSSDVKAQTPLPSVREKRPQTPSMGL